MDCWRQAVKMKQGGRNMSEGNTSGWSNGLNGGGISSDDCPIQPGPN